jgi:transposase
MALSIQFTNSTVKTLATAWQRALARGDRRPVQRISALQMVGHRQPIPTVAAFVGVAESTLYAWVGAWLLHGVASLAYRTSPGRPAKLTKTQKVRLAELLDAGPEAAGFAYGAWSAPLVQTLIEREFGVLYNVHYVSQLLGQLGFTYQKARFVSDHLDDAARQRWLEQQWRAVVRLAQTTGALLLFSDEASFAQWGSLGYTWARRGQPPVVKTTGRRKGYKVWGLLEWFSGRLFYAGHEGRFTAAGYCAFLEGVLAQTSEALILVQDGARYHTAKATHSWLAAHADRITVVQLPSYSPDYNPIEHVWRYVKQGTHNAYFATFAALQERVKSRLRDLQADPLRVQQLMGTPLDEFIGCDALPLAA